MIEAFVSRSLRGDLRRCYAERACVAFNNSLHLGLGYARHKEFAADIESHLIEGHCVGHPTASHDVVVVRLTTQTNKMARKVNIQIA